MFVEVVIMTNNTQFKTLVNTWLNQKKPMITPSTHASFTLIAENHLIPYFGKRKIGSITEADIQSYISYLYNAGRLDKTGGLTVKTIRDVILVLRLSMEYAYKERAIPLLNWDLIEYPKELGIKKVVSLSKDQEQALIQCIYMDLNRKTAGILIALFTGVRIGELCGLQMRDISLTDKTISINKTVQRIYDKKKGESYLHIGPPKTKTSARTIPAVLYEEGRIVSSYRTAEDEDLRSNDSGSVASHEHYQEVLHGKPKSLFPHGQDQANRAENISAIFHTFLEAERIGESEVS